MSRSGTRYRNTDGFDLVARMKQLEDRIRKMESQPRAGSTSIDQGRLSVRNASGIEVIQVGLLDDGNYDIAAIDPSTGETVNLAALAFGAEAAVDNTSGTTTSMNSYTDLSGTSVGPSVVGVMIGESGRCIVTISAQMQATPGGATGAKCAMSFDVGGATSVAANDHAALVFYQQISNVSDQIDFNNYIMRASYVHLLTGLNPGSHNFQAKYTSGSSASTATFTDRFIMVQPF